MSTPRLLVLLPVAALVALASAQDAPPPPRIDDARAVLERWVETQRLISRERRDWKLGREMLEERIALVAREEEAMRTRIADVEKSITEADRRRDELVARNDALKSASAELAADILRLEEGTRALLKRLPDPIRERVRPLSQRLPEAGASTDPSLALRFQNVVGILNEINKFNREITVTSEVRPQTDGTSLAVTAIYFGIGRGYYVAGDRQVAGIGIATEEGWTWEPADDAAPAIASAIAVVKGEQVPAFVLLPFSVR
jgi:hypothetical protein